MSADLATLAPRAMAPFCRAVIVGDREALHAAPLEAATLRDALDRFARGYDRPDPAALASLWSMYHLNAVIIPAVADLLCRDRILPVAAGTIGLRLDATGLPASLVLPDTGRPATAGDHGSRFDLLVRGHLAPFVALLGSVAPVTPRVLWSNAGTIFEWACTTVAARALPAPKQESLALLTGRGVMLCDPSGRLAGAVRDMPDGSRERRVCCMRYRLAGCSPCDPVCPARAAATQQDASPLASAGARL